MKGAKLMRALFVLVRECLELVLAKPLTVDFEKPQGVPDQILIGLEQSVLLALEIQVELRFGLN